MRYDLEIDIVSFLSKKGLENISDIMYGDHEFVEKMNWDTRTVSPMQNLGTVNTETLNPNTNIPENLFVSGNTDSEAISLQQIIRYDGSMYAAFNGGEFYSHKTPVEWSANRIVGQFSYVNGAYQYVLDEDYDLDTIQIYTLQLKAPGYNTIKRNYVYVKYDGVSTKSTFESSTDRYKFTIVDRTVYLSDSKITYSYAYIGKVNNNNLFALPEFPASEMAVWKFAANNYDIKGGVIAFKRDMGSNSLVNGEDISVSYSVYPIISFKQKTRSEERPDIVFENTNISPKSLNFNNGTLCAFYSYRNDKLPTSLSISLSTEDKIGYADTVKVTANISGIDGIPLEDKEIKFTVVSGNATIQESGLSTHTSLSALDGSTAVTVTPGEKKLGNYIQKEWIKNVSVDGVTKGQITLPFRLTSLGQGDLFTDPDVLGGVYLYHIMSDDPILGKMYNYAYESRVDERYDDTTMQSYYVSGRKAAYVDMKDVNGRVSSRFVKPSKIEIKRQSNVEFRNLFIGDSNNTILSFVQDAHLISQDPSVVNSGKYETGVLPADSLDTWSKEFSEVTVLTYDQVFPSAEEVMAMWIATDKTIKVQASYQDDYVELLSEIKDIKVKAMESEFAFVIAGLKTPGYNVSLNDFGYLTISEYFANPFGLTSCSYYCIHSDAIDKKCVHKTQLYHKYYQLDSGGVGCIHTPEYDATIDEKLRCPGVDARIVNPFLPATT